MKGLQGSFCQDSGSLNMCHHVHILGTVIWPLPGSCGRGWWTRRDQREGACVSHQKTTRTGKRHSQEAKKGEAWSCARGETLLTFSSRGGLCIDHTVTTLQVVTTAPGVVWSTIETWLENSAKARLSSGEQGRNSGSNTLPPIISFWTLEGYVWTLESEYYK